MRTRLARQACESCRKRKVKCDANPRQCSNCSALDLYCQYSTQRRKRGPKPRASAAGVEADATLADLTSTPVAPDIQDTSDLQTENRVSPHLAGNVAPDLRTPQSLVDLSSPIEGEPLNVIQISEVGHGPQQVHQRLNEAFATLQLPIQETVFQCIDSFLLWTFPLCPVIHPLTCRQFSHLLLPSSSHLFAPGSGREHGPQGVDMRAFALVTSVCAMVCSRRHFLVNQSDALLEMFLSASRSMFTFCQDWDVSHPDSSSLILRIGHSAALHYLGQTTKSWYVLGDAARLAMDMRLHLESSYHELDSLEARLQRILFMTLSVSDMSASILNSRPLMFRDMYLGRENTLHLGLQENFALLGTSEAHCEPPYEAQLYEGVYLSYRLWSEATALLLDMRTLSRLYVRASCNVPSQDPIQLGIMEAYMKFCGILDALPSWLQSPENHSAVDDATTTYQRQAFWHQRANIVLTFHCLRLVLLRTAIDTGLCALLGLTDNHDMLALRKIEIASDLAAATSGMPFEALQANGEPLVEKLRQAGISLLEIVHQNDKKPVASRANSLLSTIIEIIARLDSRVSDELQLSGRDAVDPLMMESYLSAE